MQIKGSQRNAFRLKDNKETLEQILNCSYKSFCNKRHYWDNWQKLTFSGDGEAAGKSLGMSLMFRLWLCGITSCRENTPTFLQVMGLSLSNLLSQRA